MAEKTPEKIEDLTPQSDVPPDEARNVSGGATLGTQPTLSPPTSRVVTGAPKLIVPCI